MKSLQAIASVLIALNILLLSGCDSNKLSRAQAEKLIRAFHKFPIDEIGKFQTSFPDNSGAGSLEKLQTEGLLTYTKNFTGLGGYWFYATLTEKGKQYATSEEYGDNFNKYVDVKVSKLDFGEITGIIEYKESNTAVVNYTYIRKDLTPFGKIQFNLQEGANPYTHTFTKYDDGWRLTQ